MLFRKRKSPQELGMLLRTVYPAAFGADMFHRLFDAKSFAEGRSIDEALAEWHAFGAFVFTHCVWLAVKDRDAISTVLDSFRPGVLRLLSGNDYAYSFFLEIAERREADYMKRFAALRGGNGAKLFGFFTRAVSRIIGSFSEEAESAGLPQDAPIDCVVPLSEYTMGVMSCTKDAITKNPRIA